MTRKRRRLYTLIAGIMVLGTATALVLVAFQDNLVFFYSPSDLKEKELPPGRQFRLGGLVQEDSVERGGAVVRFTVTDLNETVPVSYQGILPDLFREGQGVVAEGSLNDRGVFIATNVLAKHDENYMPREVQEALEKSGQWRGEEEKAEN